MNKREYDDVHYRKKTTASRREMQSYPVKISYSVRAGSARRVSRRDQRVHLERVEEAAQLVRHAAERRLRLAALRALALVVGATQRRRALLLLRRRPARWSAAPIDTRI